MKVSLHILKRNSATIKPIPDGFSTYIFLKKATNRMLILFAKIWSQNVATVEEDIVESHTSGVPPLVPRRPSTQHPPALAYFEGTNFFWKYCTFTFQNNCVWYQLTPKFPLLCQEDPPLSIHLASHWSVFKEQNMSNFCCWNCCIFTSQNTCLWF